MAKFIKLDAKSAATLEAVAVLKDVHQQVRAVLTRIDASLAEIRASEQALADGSFRAQVVAETRAWFDAHPEADQGIVDLFAPRAVA